MSFDLILWRGVPEGGPDLAWSRLVVGDPVAGLAPFTTEEVLAAFKAACRGEVQIQGTEIFGRDFSVGAEDGALYLHITCAWSVARDAAAQRPIHDAARRLDATVFDPQLAKPPPVVTRSIAAAAEWGTSHGYEGELPAERATTLAGMTFSSMPPDRGPLLEQVHALFVHHASKHQSRTDAMHPANLDDLVCTYARLAPDTLPFEVVIACGHGTYVNRSYVLDSRLPRCLIGIAGGRLGILSSPVSTYGKDADGAHVSTWKAIRLEPGGPAHDARGDHVDLTSQVADAARAALARAHAGDTLPLRSWLAAMVSIDAGGGAAFEHEAPEVFEAGAVMKLWAQYMFAVRIVEARLRLPDRGGFALVIGSAAGEALPRALPAPVGRG
ncbi:MAG: hypothetical protein WKG01_22865 [Kofleriaceae bacterium]